MEKSIVLKKKFRFNLNILNFTTLCYKPYKKVFLKIGIVKKIPEVHRTHPVLTLLPSRK